MSKTMKVELTREERALLMFALGAATTTCYDGTRKFGPESDRTFVKFHMLALKIAALDEEKVENKPK